MKLLERCLPRETPRVQLTEQQKADRVKVILDKHTKLLTYSEWVLAERIKHSGSSEDLTACVTPQFLGDVGVVASSSSTPALTRDLSRLASSPKEEEVWGTDCAVCLSEFENSEQVRELPCDHIFHDDCINSWFLKAKTAACPLCRNLLHSGESQDQITASPQPVQLAANASSMTLPRTVEVV